MFKKIYVFINNTCFTKYQTSNETFFTWFVCIFVVYNLSFTRTLHVLNDVTSKNNQLGSSLPPKTREMDVKRTGGKKQCKLAEHYDGFGRVTTHEIPLFTALTCTLRCHMHDNDQCFNLFTLKLVRHKNAALAANSADHPHLIRLQRRLNQKVAM